ncbi:MAG TPA: hypothetical protein VGR03_07045 [Candidatus Acidoferrum sp.]|nr:hypothetical protein [Candidatus Acidoferrum sp.]
MSNEIAAQAGVDAENPNGVASAATNQAQAGQLPEDETAKKVRLLEEQFNTLRSVKDRQVSDAERRARDAEGALAAQQSETVQREQAAYDAWAANAEPEDKLKAELERANRQWALHATALNRERMNSEKWRAAAQYGLDPAKVEAAQSPTDLNNLIASKQAEAAKTEMRDSIRKEVEAEYAKRTGQPAAQQPAKQAGKIVEMRGQDGGVSSLTKFQQATQDFEDKKISKVEFAKIRADFQRNMPSE